MFYGEPRTALAKELGDGLVIYEETFDAFMALTPAARVAVLSKLADKWCRHCGDRQPEGRFAECQCSNDE